MKFFLKKLKLFTHQSFWIFLFITNSKPHKDKFTPQATKCVFIGYITKPKAYKVFDIQNKIFFFSLEMSSFMNKVFSNQHLHTQKNAQSPLYFAISLKISIESPKMVQQIIYIYLPSNTPSSSSSTLDSLLPQPIIIPSEAIEPNLFRKSTKATFKPKCMLNFVAIISSNYAEVTDQNTLSLVYTIQLTLFSVVHIIIL